MVGGGVVGELPRTAKGVRNERPLGIRRLVFARRAGKTKDTC